MIGGCFFMIHIISFHFGIFIEFHRYIYCQKAGNEPLPARAGTQRDDGCLGPPLPRDIIVCPRAAPLAASKHSFK